MTANSRSATAYDTLAMLTERYIAFQKLAQDWLVIMRASKKAMDDNEEHAVLFESEKQYFTDSIEYCRNHRDGINVKLIKLEKQMSTLNEQIQNGVFNEQETA